MGRVKFGEGISLEVPIAKSSKMDKVDTVSDRQYQLDDALKSIKNEMGIVEEKVDENASSILNMMDLINQLGERGVKISHPEVKSITVHRDHQKDIEDMYSYILHHDSTINEKLKVTINMQMKYNKMLKKAIGVLGFGLVLSLMLHLI